MSLPESIIKNIVQRAAATTSRQLVAKGARASAQIHAIASSGLTFDQKLDRIEPVVKAFYSDLKQSDYWNQEVADALFTGIERARLVLETGHTQVLTRKAEVGRRRAEVIARDRKMRKVLGLR